MRNIQIHTSCWVLSREDVKELTFRENKTNKTMIINLTKKIGEKLRHKWRFPHQLLF